MDFKERLAEEVEQLNKSLGKLSERYRDKGFFTEDEQSGWDDAHMTYLSKSSLLYSISKPRGETEEVGGTVAIGTVTPNQTVVPEINTSGVTTGRVSVS